VGKIIQFRPGYGMLPGTAAQLGARDAQQQVM
jgi:hypothetical protein